MRKSWTIALVALFGMVLLCCGGGVYIMRKGLDAFRQEITQSSDRGKDIVLALGKRWRLEDVRDRVDPNIKSDDPKVKSALGALAKSYGAIQEVSKFSLNDTKALGQTKVGSESDPRTRVTFCYGGTFTAEKGKANVELVIRRGEGGKWMLRGLQVKKPESKEPPILIGEQPTVKAKVL